MQSEQLDQLAPALAAAAAELQSVSANRTGQSGARRYRYADLDAYLEVVRPVLAKHGIVLVQRPMAGDGTLAHIETVLLHTSGQLISGELVIQPEKTGAQALGSAITYARRYSLAAMLGLTTEEDDDGKKASESSAKAPAKATGGTIRVDARAPLVEPDTEREIRAICQELQVEPEKLRAALAVSGATKIGELRQPDADRLLLSLKDKRLRVQGEAAF